MGKVIIGVKGGHASVESNERNVNVVIIDHDNLESGAIGEVLSDGTEDVTIEVWKGIADVTQCNQDIEVEIMDYDSEQNQ